MVNPKGQKIPKIYSSGNLKCIPWCISDSVLDREKRSDRLTAYACEDTTLNITCGPDLYLDVIRANYGRFSITICNVHGNTEWKVDCQAGRTLRAMQTRCSNKNQCIVPVQSSIFGDPCPGTYKYIEVHYTCRKGNFYYSVRKNLIKTLQVLKLKKFCIVGSIIKKFAYKKTFFSQNLLHWKRLVLLGPIYHLGHYLRIVGHQKP